jgi:hypothetical protein
LEQQAVIAQPDQLATLHRQGTLSGDEFTTAKARPLAS